MYCFGENTSLAKHCCYHDFTIKEEALTAVTKVKSDFGMEKDSVVEWKCVLKTFGGQCVMMAGM